MATRASTSHQVSLDGGKYIRVTSVDKANVCYILESNRHYLRIRLNR